jgi:hypothetical protein
MRKSEDWRGQEEGGEVIRFHFQKGVLREA